MNFDRYLESIKLAGSHAKGTELRDSDYDLFLTYSPGTPGPLSAIQQSLADAFHGRIRNVSVRIEYKGLSVDLVPSRNNRLWQARFDTWLKTDIDKQIRYVRDSGFIDQILALKIWRRRHALKFPSFLMELAAIRAEPRNFRDVLHFLATGFPTARLIDPGNSNNVVSDLLTEVEKLHISRKAQMYF
jgi:hypothetical protein